MFSSPDGAVIEPKSNRLYVVDEGNRRIQVFDLADVWKAKSSGL